jgi:DNA polymerase-3 subunit alpha
MDDYRELARRAGAVSIGDVLASFEEAQDGAYGDFRDGQQVLLAGIISSVKTKTTKNNSLMAYVTLEDGGGSMEMLVFQRTLSEAGQLLSEGTPVLARGKISLRDEKEPQLLCDMMAPIEGYASETSGNLPGVSRGADAAGKRQVGGKAVQAVPAFPHG